MPELGVPSRYGLGEVRTGMRWDPAQYARYADERGRPFLDLVARIDAAAPRRVVDLGCGPGTMTARLAERWPTARIEGIDASEEMVAAALPLSSDRLTFRVGDVTEWPMPDDVDVVLSNAVLQWVPGHRELVGRWAAQLPAGAWLAFQVPANFDAPSHALMRALAQHPRWATRLAGVLRHHDTIATAEQYAASLLGAGLTVDVWTTTYLHVLHGTDPVVDWLRGTGLRPVLAALPPEDGAAFTAELATALRAAYPPTSHGTLLPFRRLFAVAHR